MFSQILDQLFNPRERDRLRRVIRRARRLGSSKPAMPLRFFEAMEPRVLLSAATLTSNAPQFQFNDADGDQVTVRLVGPGTIDLTLVDDVANNADLASLIATGTTTESRIEIEAADKGTNIPTLDLTSPLELLSMAAVDGVLRVEALNVAQGDVTMTAQEVRLAGGDYTLLDGMLSLTGSTVLEANTAITTVDHNFAPQSPIDSATDSVAGLSIHVEGGTVTIEKEIGAVKPQEYLHITADTIQVYADLNVVPSGVVSLTATDWIGLPNENNNPSGNQSATFDSIDTPQDILVLGGSVSGSGGSSGGMSVEYGNDASGGVTVSGPGDPGEDVILFTTISAASVTTLNADNTSFTFTDADGDQVTVVYKGAGTADITLDGDADDNADINTIELDGTDGDLTITVKKAGDGDGTSTLDRIFGTGSLEDLKASGVHIEGDGVTLAGSLETITATSLRNGADVTTTVDGGEMKFAFDQVIGTGGNVVMIVTPSGIAEFKVDGDANHLAIDAAGDLNKTQFDGNATNVVIESDGSIKEIKVAQAADTFTATATMDISKAEFSGNATDTTITAAAGSIGEVKVKANATDLTVTAATEVKKVDISGAATDLSVESTAANIGDVKVKGDATNITVAAATEVKKIDFSANATNVAATAGENLGEVKIKGDGDTITASGATEVKKVEIGGTANDVTVNATAGNIGDIKVKGDATNITAIANTELKKVDLGANATDVTATAGENLGEVKIKGDGDTVTASGATEVKKVEIGGTANDVTVNATAGNIGDIKVKGDATNITAIANTELKKVDLGANATDVTATAGENLGEVKIKGDGDTITASGATEVKKVEIGGTANDVTVIAGTTIGDVKVKGATTTLGVTAASEIKKVDLGDAATDVTVTATTGAIGDVKVKGAANNITATAVTDIKKVDLGAAATVITVNAATGAIGDVKVKGVANTLNATAATLIKKVDIGDAADDVTVTSTTGNIGDVKVKGDATNITATAATELKKVDMGANATNITAIAGENLGEVKVKGIANTVTATGATEVKKVEISDDATDITVTTTAGEIGDVKVKGATQTLAVTATTTIKKIELGGNADGVNINAGGDISGLKVNGSAQDITVNSGAEINKVEFGDTATDVSIQAVSDLGDVKAKGAVQTMDVTAADIKKIDIGDAATDLTVNATGTIKEMKIKGAATNITAIAGSEIGKFNSDNTATNVALTAGESIGEVKAKGAVDGLTATAGTDLTKVDLGDAAANVHVNATTGTIKDIKIKGIVTTLSATAGVDLNKVDLGAANTGVTLNAGANIDSIKSKGAADTLTAAAGGEMGQVQIDDTATGVTLTATTDIDGVKVKSDILRLAIAAGGTLKSLEADGNATDIEVNLGGNLDGKFNVKGMATGIDAAVTGTADTWSFQQGLTDAAFTVGGTMKAIDIKGDATDVTALIGGSLDSFTTNSNAPQTGAADNTRVKVVGEVNKFDIAGAASNGSFFVAGGDITTFATGGDIEDTSVLAGALLNSNFDFATGTFSVAEIRTVDVDGDVIDSIISAGGDPGDDGLFVDGEVLAGSRINTLKIAGQVIGIDSPHINPGIYTGEIGSATVNGTKATKEQLEAGFGVVGTAVIDPLPTGANELTTADLELIIRQAVTDATNRGVNATISITDREGNILALVRMTDGSFDPAAAAVTIEAGGTGGLEAITADSGLVSTALVAATKAGTASFLSTNANAFTTRTAASIIGEHFPADSRFQDAGPLFGVQLSNLPTSDINRLPLGLSADPGGVPLYRGGELIGGIGIEVDGIYTVATDHLGRHNTPTVEESIALAGQAGFGAPANIRASSVFIDGIRIAYSNADTPAPPSPATLPTYGALLIDEIIAPLAAAPESAFSITMLNGRLGEVPDMSLNGEGTQDFFNNAADAGPDGFEFIAGDFNAGEQLTAADVETILTQSHTLAEQLRAQIRRDDAQQAQVTVSVVDINGNLLGSFRSIDAPIFGYDVSVQKARTAAFFSRADAGTQLTALDAEVAVATLQSIFPAGDEQLVDPGVLGPYARHVAAALELGVGLDGTVAVADRTGGFLSRPNLPDGIDNAAPGPFSALGTDEFSPFNTGLQTALLLPKLVDFLTAYIGAGSDAAAFADFSNDGIPALGGGGVVALDSNAGAINPGGGLPENSLANGMQIFAGSVPLYKDGVLVGAVGVSGDGIEQDDYIAAAGAEGFQEFGDVIRADYVTLSNGLRLPYVKYPRSPFL